MEANSGGKRKTTLATKPWWGPSATATKATVGPSGPKNNLSASKWATTPKTEEKTVGPSEPKNNLSASKWATTPKTEEKTVGPSEPKNNLSASKWATTPKTEEKTVGPSEPKNNLSASKWATTPKTKKTVRSSELKNNLSASKWATTPKTEKKITPPTDIPKENVTPIRKPARDAGDSDHHVKDMDPSPGLSLNLARDHKMLADVNAIHPEQTPGGVENSIFRFTHEATKYLWAPPEPIIHDNPPTISHSDTALDDDGDVVMVDLNDPYIIQEVTEFTRNQRQTEQMSEYVDLKPGLKPTVSKSRIAQPSCLLVIDTSFILPHLPLVDSLVNSHPHWKNVVVVPWATIQELDGLKKSPHRPGGTDVSKLARNANNWAFKVFSRLDPGVWGQTKEECKDPSGRGDSAILDCCRYFGARNETILLSNDRNLCVQAMIHNIKTVTIINEPHTAETILTRILGDPAHIKESRKFVPHPQSPPSVDHAGLMYKPLSNYTPPTLPADNQVPSAAPSATHKSTSVYIQSTYRTADVDQQMIQPAFYPSISRDEINYLPYGTKDKKKTVSPSVTGNGLEVSIYAVRNVIQRPQYRTQAIKTVRPPLRVAKSFLEPKTTVQNGKSDAEIKNNLNYFLQGTATELVANLVPLLRQCARDKLRGPTQLTLEALNCCPEKQVCSITDLEKFFHSYWVPVFREYLPAKHGQVLKSGGLNRRWSEWISWTEFSEPGDIGPKMEDVRKWIEEWDFIWKRILPTEATERQVDTNMNTVDRWRTALLGVGLAVERFIQGCIFVTVPDV